MQKRVLGKSGLEVSPIGLGCWAIGGPWTFGSDEDRWQAGWGQIDDAESVRAIHAGLDLGINFLDTAANYGAGHSECVLAQALAGKREEVVVATKFGFLVNEDTKDVGLDDDAIVGNIRQDCEDSLRRLGTDYIDIFQLHQGGLDREKAPAVMDVLEELVKEGKIRWYGWSTDDHENAAVFAKGERCTSIQFDLNVFRDNPEIRQICADADLGGINKSPLNRGILTGKFDESSTFPEDDIRHGLSFTEGIGAERLEQLEKVREILTSNGHSLAQGSLAYIWALDERMVPIPGFKTVAQVQENAKAMELGPLEGEQVKEIQSILNGQEAN
ncbi:MAG: aldo/keto reductase [Chloroflexi bacterium]|nr:MAG: aldo/keto reductase [Chloroflexota bacterium]MBL1192913.1 aldo/keto reductase [Chloroflexota bacterium]NOH10206.1 aldo/keto reductase [Chloroflexota bacterium]